MQQRVSAFVNHSWLTRSCVEIAQCPAGQQSQSEWLNEAQLVDDIIGCSIQMEAAPTARLARAAMLANPLFAIRVRLTPSLELVLQAAQVVEVDGTPAPARLPVTRARGRVERDR